VAELSPEKRKAIAKAKARQRLKDQESVMLREKKNKPGYIAGAINELTDSAMFGFGSEASAGVSALLSTMPGSGYTDRLAENYYNDYANREVAQNNYQRDNPNTAFGSQMAGGVLSGLGTAKLAAPYLRNFSPLGAVSTLGAGEGALYGAGMSPPGDRLMGAATGAGVGGVAAPLILGGGKAAMGVLRPVAKRVQDALFASPRERAKRIIIDAIENEGLTPEEAITIVRNMGDEALLADIGDSLPRLARSVTAEMGPSASRAKLFLDTRQSGQQMRLRQSAREATADGSFDESLVALTNNAESKASPLYDEAYSYVISPTEGMMELMQRPAMQRAINKAKTILKNEGFDPEDIMNVRFADATKSSLDDQIGAARRQGKANEVRILTRLKNQFVQEIDAQAPVYAEARRVFGGEAAIREAAEFGRNMFRGRSTSVPDAQEAIAAMGESELRAARVGFLDWLADEMSNQSVNRNFAEKFRAVPKYREFVGLLFPDQNSVDDFLRTAANESTFSRTRNTITGGSPTARIQADRGLLDSGILGTAADAALSQESLILQLLRNLRGNTKMSPEIAKEVGEILFTARPSDNILRASPMNRSIPRMNPMSARGVAAGVAGAGQEEIIDSVMPFIGDMRRAGLL